MPEPVANPDGQHPCKEGPLRRNHFMIGPGKGNIPLECVYCGRGSDKEWLGNATRARQHLSADVAKCKKVPDDMRSLLKKNFGASASKPLAQQTLMGGSSEMMSYTRHEDARAAEMHCIIFNGIPFHVVDSPAWREMVKALAAAGPTYKPVNRKALASTELDKQVADENKDVRRLLATTKQYGYSITSDGWTDVNKTYAQPLPLLERMIVFPAKSHLRIHMQFVGKHHDRNSRRPRVLRC